MKIFKTVLIVIVSLIALLAIVGLFLPSHTHVDRSIVIQTKSNSVFKQVNNLKNWQNWSPWYRMDSTAAMSYSDNPEGSGAWFSWNSKNGQVGVGKLTILESKMDEQIKVEMVFGDMHPSYSAFEFKPEGEGVKVTWSFDSDMGRNPFKHLLGALMDKLLGPVFESGLQNMKVYAENLPQGPTIAGCDAQVKDLNQSFYIGVREKIKFADMGKKLGEIYGQLGEEMKKQDVNFSGPPFTIDHAATADEGDVTVGIPTTLEMKANGKMKPGKFEKGKAFVVSYYGRYEGTSKVFAPAFEYLKANNMKCKSAPIEFYVTDPMNEKDTAKWLTEICFPLEVN